MNRTDPPRFATWMLEHLTLADRDGPLTGDLVEDFRTGRSHGWYWRQVIAAIVFGWIRSIFHHRFALLFAALWSMLAPAWLLIIFKLEMQKNLIGYVWRIPWPWSSICDFGLSVAECLLFICAGMLIYLILHRKIISRVSLRCLAQGCLLGLLAYGISWGCMVALLLIITAPHHAPHPMVDERTLTILGGITFFGLRSSLARLAYFVGTACSLWAVETKVERVNRIDA